jgi:hypothetical protein
VPKTPYKMWIDRKSTLNYLHVWGCPVEAKLFNSSIGKLDHKTVSCHFICYPDKSKGFRFYCPDRYIKIVETGHTIFLEDEVIRGNMVPREIRLEEKRVCVPNLMVAEPFFDTCCCYTHGAGQCGCITRCRFSCTCDCNAYCWFSDDIS